MKAFIFIAAFAACSMTKGSSPMIDGNGDSISDSQDPSGDGSANPDAIQDDAPPIQTCTGGTTGTRCSCLVGGAGCTSGDGCYWQFNNDMTPKNYGTCEPLGAVSLGGSCGVNLPSPCVQGAWCAWTSSSATTGMGICRKVCDPMAGLGCDAGQSCIAVPYCANPGDYPNCPPASNSHVGYCQ